MYPQDNLVTVLQHLPWFNGMNPNQLEQLARIATIYNFEPGDLLFSEGDRDDSLYVLLEGQVTMEIEVPTRGQTAYYIAEMLDIIGWSSMTPIVRQRIARARATQASLVLGFNSKLLQQLCDDDQEIGYVVFRKLANVVANGLLTMRLCLMEIIVHPVEQQIR
ncbi:MAG: cyclic nucleotide-binding domain-containing protein [Anaerolineaceae bacterium]|nr:cyclic nucleotide-binding domain-containing protein [Anaerolineaceae bacterium]